MIIVENSFMNKQMSTDGIHDLLQSKGFNRKTPVPVTEEEL